MQILHKLKDSKYMLPTQRSNKENQSHSLFGKYQFNLTYGSFVNIFFIIYLNGNVDWKLGLMIYKSNKTLLICTEDIRLGFNSLYILSQQETSSRKMN